MVIGDHLSIDVREQDAFGQDCIVRSAALTLT